MFLSHDVLLDEELAEGVDCEGCRAQDKQDLNDGEPKDAACEAILGVTIAVFLSS